MSEYQDLLGEWEWKRCREIILQRDGHRCRHCGFNPKTDRGLRHITDLRNHLEVHHLYYLPGRKPWEYPADALVTLCNTCHGLVSFSGLKLLDEPPKDRDWIINLFAGRRE